MSKARILLLFSGGLDSLLAAKALLEAGAELSALHFVTPFTGSLDYLQGEVYLQEWGVEIRRVAINVEAFRHLLLNPPHGFGKAMNPCIDCKILFMRKAKQIMETEAFDAIASGEVLGERPMSQNKLSLDIIERDGELAGKLLRPLSAKLLPETEVEKQGLIDRNKLYAIEGRGRKPQIELARIWGIEEYATPAGGCLLTEPAYCAKLKDLMDRNEDSDETVKLLKTGRHFRYTDGSRLIVGRNEKENLALLEHAAPNRTFFDVKNTGSPIGLLFAAPNSPELIKWSAAVVARYCDNRLISELNVTYWVKGAEESVVNVRPLNAEEVELWRIQ